MKKQCAFRIGWSMFALPLALISLITILATWPLVLNNSPTHLLLIAYVVMLPVVPMAWTGRRHGPLIASALVTVIAQVLAFGFLNLWFQR